MADDLEKYINDTVEAELQLRDQEWKEEIDMVIKMMTDFKNRAKYSLKPPYATVIQYLKSVKSRMEEGR